MRLVIKPACLYPSNVYKQVPIIPYGGATSIEGHTLSPSGGVCIDMTLMKVRADFSYIIAHDPSPSVVSFIIVIFGKSSPFLNCFAVII